MLEFFRRYQKFFFLFVAFIMITSFAFFGTYGAMSAAPVREDRVVGRAIDGSNMKLSELSALSRLIAADYADLSNGSRNVAPNLLNDGVIRKDFLATGVAEILVRQNLELLKGDLDQKLHRIKAYRGYEHPDAPFISAKAVWQRFAPDLNREWSLLQSAEGIDGDTFGHLARLYHFQTALPPEWLRRILMMHEQQYNQWLRPDPRLRQDDLALFGFHSVADWFGGNFVDLVAEFIHNAAIEAKAKGYSVSLEEAKADLASHFSESIQKVKTAKIPLELTYKEQLRLLGLDESQAAAAWSKVLLMRRYFSDRGGSVFLDTLPYSEFAAIAKEKAIVDLYQWPAALNLTSALDLYTFQTYIHAIAPQDKGDPLALPKTILPLKEVEAKSPELVATQYKAKLFAVDKREAALKASLKELWAFETEEQTWKALRSEFSFMQPLSSKTADERFQSLSKLDPVQRSLVDQFARRKLVDRHPEWLDEALSCASGEEKTLILSAGKVEVPHVDDPMRLGSLFEQILSSPESALFDLNRFESKDAVFRFENIEKTTDTRIKTFEEALKDGSMGEIVTRALEAEFSNLRSKLPADKEFSELKEEIAALLLADLRKKIVAATESLEDDSSYASRRLAAPALRARADLEKNPNDTQWIQVEGEDPLTAQFKLQRTEKQIPRTAEEAWMSKEPFIFVPSTWSPVHVDLDGTVSFIYVKNRIASKEPILDQLSVGKEVLSSDVQRLLADKLLRAMQKKRSIVIPLQPEQE